MFAISVAHVHLIRCISSILDLFIEYAEGLANLPSSRER